MLRDESTLHSLLSSSTVTSYLSCSITTCSLCLAQQERVCPASAYCLKHSDVAHVDGTTIDVQAIKKHFRLGVKRNIRYSFYPGLNVVLHFAPANGDRERCCR